MISRFSVAELEPPRPLTPAEPHRRFPSPTPHIGIGGAATVPFLL
jgi:hypothetical protein